MNKKRFLALFLSFIMIFMLTVSAYADNSRSGDSGSDVEEISTEVEDANEVEELAGNGTEQSTVVGVFENEEEIGDAKDNIKSEEEVNKSKEETEIASPGNSSYKPQKNHNRREEKDYNLASDSNWSLASGSNCTIASYSNMVRTEQDEKMHITLVKGSKVYKEPSIDSKYIELNFDVSVTVENHYYNDEDNSEEWYEISYDNWLIHIISYFVDYHFVPADDAEIELGDSDIPACNCGYSGESGLTAHADACARKDYIRNTYIVDKTAEEIYDDWDELDIELQNAVLEFLSCDDPIKLKELKRLIKIDIPLCSCGYSEEGGLTAHADDCARKAYVRNIYIVYKTAEEIYGDWNELDTELQNAILEFLSWDDPDKLKELNALFEKVKLAAYMPSFYGTTDSGVTVNIYAGDDAFSDGASMMITDTTVDESTVEELIMSNERSVDLKDFEIVKIKAVDIDFGEQPASEVTLQMLVSADEVPDSANQLYIVHFGDAGAEIVDSRALRTDITTHNIVVTVDSFSSYAAVFVNGKYSSSLMSDVIEENDAENQYSIVPFKVNLFDYSPKTFNSALADKLGSGNHFQFVGYDTGVKSNGGVNDSSSGYAKQGIVADKLVNGLPVFNYVTDGDDNARAFFDTGYQINGKTSYDNVDFEFIYDDSTGYYEYKSSANHAQFHADEGEHGTIKLYADTLSTENNSSPSAVSLENYTGVNDISNINVSDEIWEATFKDVIKNENDRFDPYVSFLYDSNGKPLEVNADDVNQIYVKAKIPDMVGKNQMQVFFQYVKDGKTFGYQETQSFLVDYTANGGWIEFVIDTTKDKNGSGIWKGKTITGIRLDLFDENKGAIDKTKEYTVQVSEITFIKTNETHQTWGGFYPFTDIADTYPGNSTEPFSFENWKDEIADSGDATALATRSMGNPKLDLEALTEELAFGTVMEFDFYIPVGAPTEEEKHLTYYFNGDDDLWVFVDDNLVLDIGGGHGAISGTVDFTEGTATVASAVKVTGYDSNDSDDGSSKSVKTNLAAELTSAGKHTMKIFYMERCGSVSNCHMKFNLPQTPKGSVTVSKTLRLKNYDGNSDDAAILDAENFEFTIAAEYQLSGEPEAFSLSYDVQNSDGTIVSGTEIGEGNKFTLKHGQTAYFYIPEGYDVTVTETSHSISGYGEMQTTVNGKAGLSDVLRTRADGNTNFAFVNMFEEETVTYTYIPVNPEGCPDNVKGTVELTGNTDSATYDIQGVKETIGKRVDDPVGSTATGSTAVKFVGWYEDPACTTVVDSGKATVEGSIIDPVQTEGLFTGGTFYAKFEYTYGDLTITKSGIQVVDHHEADSSSNEEKQSTMFRVEGKDYSGTEINMTVTICGNGSVTIRHLPLGTYTVTEITGWSWRYKPEDGEQEVSVEYGKVNEVTFENDRTEKYWLSGDSYAENWWTELTSVIRKPDESQ